MDQSSKEKEEATATVAKAKRRWVKVDVDEDVFVSLHMRAAESRMRIMPYLRLFLAEARSLVMDGSQSFSTQRRATPGGSRERVG